jgi:uncharacterized protein YmfQ (DUF2313 family)
MPQGALDLAEGSLFFRLFQGLAIELARFDALCDTYLMELDHTTTVDLISDFERFLDLPRSCQTPIPESLSLRRAIVAAVLERPRDISPATMIEIAAIYGFTITIGEHFAPDAASTFFKYDVTVAEEQEVVAFTTGTSQAGDALGSIEQLGLTCLLNEIEPAYAELVILP